MEVRLGETELSVVIDMLRTERASLSLWHQVAMYHYGQGRFDDFVRTMEGALEEADKPTAIRTPEFKELKMRLLTDLAAHISQVHVPRVGGHTSPTCKDCLTQFLPSPPVSTAMC